MGSHLLEVGGLVIFRRSSSVLVLVRENAAPFHGETRWAAFHDDENSLLVDTADPGNSGGNLDGKLCGVLLGVAFTHPAADQHRARRRSVGVETVRRQFVKGDIDVRARHMVDR